MGMTDAQVITLTRAAVLLAPFCGELSDFEVETVAETGRRYLAHGREAVITAAEWEVVERAVEAMAKAAARPRVRRTAA